MGSSTLHGRTAGPASPVSRARHVRRGRIVRAGFLALALLPALAAVQGTLLATPARAASIAAPDLTICSRLVWATMIAVDNANRTGNYSVLRGIGSTGFRDVNSTRQLADVFATLRDNRVDVGRAVLLEPTFYLPPSVDQSGVLRLRGGFEFRPQSLRFDLLFLFEDGGWRLHGISVLETSSSTPRS